MSSDAVRRQIDDLETAAFELADACADYHADLAGREADAAAKRYDNWAGIVRELANALRLSLGLPERRPDVEAYEATGG